MTHDMTSSATTSTEPALFSRPMLAVLAAQFLSALADNALLFAAIALLKAAAAPDWQMPLLHEFFVIAFIVLAPFVGPVADSWPKGRVMLAGNSFKILGVLAMAGGLHPLLAYGIVGLGAAVYSPAKYGILSELVGPSALVKANSLMEGSSIVAILLGAVAGGLLADYSVDVALGCIITAYTLAALVNLLIPRLPPAHPAQGFAPLALLRDFWAALCRLSSNPDARFSLLGTSLFWGTGSTLRFLLVAWVPVALLITDNSTPANLSGVVAVGIALGAVAAARFVSLQTVNRALPAGLMIGVLILIFAQQTTLAGTIVMLILLGACGGFYVVPLNALLQERGHESVGAGHAIAVQNFYENILMLVMVGSYAAVTRAGVGVIATASLFGSLLLLGTAALVFYRWRSLRARG